MRKRVFALFGLNFLSWMLFSFADLYSENHGEDFEYGHLIVIPLFVALVYIIVKTILDRKSSFKDSLFEMGVYLGGGALFALIINLMFAANIWPVEQHYTSYEMLLNGLEYPLYAGTNIAIVVVMIFLYAVIRWIVRLIIGKVKGEAVEVNSYVHKPKKSGKKVKKEPDYNSISHKAKSGKKKGYKTSGNKKKKKK